MLRFSFPKVPLNSFLLLPPCFPAIGPGFRQLNLSYCNTWSGRGDSNPRPQPWQGCALPLSYTRIRGGRSTVSYQQSMIAGQERFARVAFAVLGSHRARHGAAADDPRGAVRTSRRTRADLSDLFASARLHGRRSCGTPRPTSPAHIARPFFSRTRRAVSGLQ